MITTEIKTIGIRQFRVTASDTYLIRKIGTQEIYSEAWDLIDSSFEYEETEQPKEAENIELNV